MRYSSKVLVIAENTGYAKEKEVDFVAQKGDRILYIQTTYTLADEQTARREYASLESIRDNYEKVVVSLDDFALPSLPTRAFAMSKPGNCMACGNHSEMKNKPAKI